jgi:archaellum biogenesis ATPase FlaH
MQVSNEAFHEWFKRQKNLKDYLDGERLPDLVEGVIPGGSIVAVTGQPGEGKSFFVQSLAHAVATGRDWNGHSTQQGAVLYLNPDGEHPRYLAERFSALDNHSGRVMDYDRFFRFEDDFALTDKSHQENLLEGLAWRGLRLVVIDALASATPGLDLNSAKDISPIEKFCKEITKRSNGETSVLIVVHSPKSNSQGVSGSTQIAAFCSLIYSMEKKRDKTNGDKYLLRTVKERHSAGNYSDTYRIKQVAIEDGSTGAVLVTTEPVVQNAQTYRDELRNFFPDLEPGHGYPQMGLVKDLMSRAGKSKSSAYRWLEYATETGVLVRMGTGTETVFSIPSSQSPQTVPSGESPSVPNIPHTLKGGNWGQDESGTF